MGEVLGGVDASGEQFSLNLDWERRPAGELSQLVGDLVDEIGSDFEDGGVWEEVGAVGFSLTDLLILNEQADLALVGPGIDDRLVAGSESR